MKQIHVNIVRNDILLLLNRNLSLPIPRMC
jgi:hypothetical protein